MSEETKRKWAIAALIVFALIIIGSLFGHEETCDDQCQLQRETDRLHCIYNGGGDSC